MNIDIEEAKLKLQGFIQTALDLVKNYNKIIKQDTQMENLQKDLADIKNELEYLSRLRIVVIGNNKTGKSYLINAILEAEILHSDEDSATEFVLIIKPAKNEIPTLWKCVPNPIKLSDGREITHFEEKEKIAEGLYEVKNLMKKINKDIMGEGANELKYYLLKCEIPIFNGLSEDIFKLVEIIDSPGKNNYERSDFRINMMPKLFSSLVGFIYVTKIDSYRTDPDYQSFIDTLTKSKLHGVLGEEQVFEIVVNQYDTINYKTEEEKLMALDSIKTYFAKYFDKKEPILYSSLNELKKWSLEVFFREKYKDFKKNKFTDDFSEYLGSQYYLVCKNIQKGKPEKEKPEKEIKESDKISELTYISKNYKHYGLDFELLKKYSLIFEYENKYDKSNALRELLNKDVNKLYEVLLLRISARLPELENSFNISMELILKNKDIEFSKLDIEKVRILNHKIENKINNYHGDIKKKIEKMNNKIKEEQLEIDLNNITSLENLHKDLKKYESSLKNIKDKCYEGLTRLEEKFDTAFEHIIEEFQEITKKAGVAMPEKKGYHLDEKKSSEFIISGSSFFDKIGEKIHGSIPILVGGAGVATLAGCIAAKIHASRTAASGVSGGVGVGVGVGAGIGVGIVCCGVAIVLFGFWLDKYFKDKKDIDLLKQQFKKMNIDLEKETQNEYSEIERLMVKIRREVDSGITSVIDTITRDRANIKSNVNLLISIKAEFSKNWNKLKTYIENKRLNN
jgi:hypothetical protein